MPQWRVLSLSVFHIERETCVRVHTGLPLFSVRGSSCPRAIWDGTRRGIDNKHLTGVIIRVW